VLSHSVICGDKNIGRTANFASRIDKMIEIEAEIWELKDE
jgi:hypothetical protein